ncbi:MAG: hypothetical protein GY795_39115 [Desulfobacterales bacterium]|nr:hypothetical protein [Desulfobacterales bacterium]
MKTDSIRYKRGFTLIELLIIIQIIIILVPVLIYLEIYFTERFHVNINRQNMMEAGTRTLKWIAKDLRLADSVQIPDQNQAGSERLILNNTDGCKIIYTFDKDKRIVTRTETPAEKGHEQSVTELAHDVDYVEISPVNIGKGLIRTRIDLSHELTRSRQTITVSNIAGPRIK